MKKNIVIMFLLMLGFSTMAQQKPSSHWYLTQQFGLGSSAYADWAVSPITYKGPEAMAGLALNVDTRNFCFQLNEMVSGNLYSKSFKRVLSELNDTIYDGYSGYGLGLTSRLSAMYRFDKYLPKHSKWHLMAGLSMNNYLTMKYNANYSNASVGVTDFLTLDLKGLAEYDFGKRDIGFQKTAPQWTVSVAFDLPFASIMIRPGYSYLINATAATINYLLYATNFTGAETELACAWHLRIDDMLKLTYRWTYYTTADVGFARFDDASHLFVLSYVYRLNSK